MTKEEIQAQILILDKLVNNRPSSWRKGQALFNYSVFLFPELEQLRATNVDCFYSNELIPESHKAMEEILFKDLKSIEDIKAEEYQRGFMDCYEQSNTTGLEVQKRAFEAGRNSKPRGMCMPNKWKYETFEDYLKSLENDNGKSLLSE